ncbi:biotin-dependent carboxyltransferase family protein [Paludisphaera borealis]|uniref:KipI antagonist n=1 Tax=Paludisphaera borealis TaxID=1387353 RepID=A0A1U7CK90_9BACT|nr:biotin-dependent carboxyltransferase family protein [Paludisphaera borealis]APW59326.1 KipI antagonist [Paludisphaera borealis]
MGLLVVNPGLWTTVQDLGRPGFREWGVPVGGAFDRRSLALANAFAGNPPDAAGLELTLHGGVFEARCDLGIALAGADMEASIVDPDGGRRSVISPSSTTLKAGERLILGRATAGARTYLAVAGGFGGRSSERPVRAGDFLPAVPSRLHGRRPRPVESAATDPIGEPFRCLPGPDSSSLADSEALWNQPFQVGLRSNRMGLRLEGEPLAVVPEAERLSAPVAPGAIQAAGGRLIVLGVACGTMGGYPHVAQVISADLDRVGQLRSGDGLRFRRVTIDEARRLDRQAREAQRRWSAPITALSRDLFELEFRPEGTPG